MRGFEWDPIKARTNRHKHGIDFEDATLVFDDPYLLTEKDRREHGEQRWRSYGLVGPAILVVTVVHTWEQRGWGRDHPHHLGPQSDSLGAQIICRSSCERLFLALGGSRRHSGVSWKN